MRIVITAVSCLALAACGLSGTDRDKEEQDTTATASSDYETAADDNLADSMASRDPAEGEPMPEDQIPDSEERPMMQAQVVLDRQGFGPGVVDGKMGMSTENALRGFQEANELDITGTLDEPTKQALARWKTIPATRVVTIPQGWGELDYVEMAETTEGKAEMERLGYSSLDEKLAERFHTTVAVLKQLNPDGKPAGWTEPAVAPSPPDAAARSSATPSATRTPNAAASPSTSASASATRSAQASGAGTSRVASDGKSPQSYFTAGQQIRVPNIGGDRIAPDAVEDRGWRNTLASLGVGTQQPEIERIVVSKAGKTLRAYNGDKLVALFTVSSGSSEFPLPLGKWDIVGEAFNPPYSYNPEVLGKGEGETFTLPPGPNSPVGVVWIDLSKEHYGIHGTPDPETIGRAQSSGCVRLTNWDAARLAQMVSTETEVEFVA